MPVCRLRQVIQNIEDRQKSKRQYQNLIAEWQTKTLAQFIAATVPVDKGSKNPLAEAAEKIALKLEGDDTPEPKPEMPVEYYIENGAQAENSPGSYERLMRGFG